jgi:hypothetical protein
MATNVAPFTAFEKFKSKVNTRGEEFKKNYDAMKVLVDELNERLAMGNLEGKKSSIDRHLKAGRLLGLQLLLVTFAK